MPHLLSRRWRQWSFALGLAIATLSITPTLAWTQISPVVRDQFLSDPEFAEPRDPLLPDLPVDRPLSPLEKSELQANLDQLATAAATLYLAGQTDLAFQQWMREVRLRRILGDRAEILAMQRVGLRAWESSRSQEIQLLTLRLRALQADLLDRAEPDISLLEEIAATFEVLRDIDSAIAVYETLAVRAAQAGDEAERRRVLENMASLQESWFRFEVAGKTYQSLLNSLGSGGTSLKRVQYLQGAIRNFQDAGELRTAIQYQQRLLRQYQDTAQVQPVPSLTLAIARNYRDLNDLDDAQTYYQTTYVAALAQNQSDLARDAVQDLAAVYRDLDRPDDVLYLYRQQLAVERLSYNAYGMMQVFDRMGQFYEAQNDPDSAIKAYQEGLILARHLDYRAAYFRNRLQRLLLDQGRLTVFPAEIHQSSPVRAIDNPDAWETNTTSPGG